MKPGQIYGHYYNKGFLGSVDRKSIMEWLATLHPIWEMRYSEHSPPPEGQTNRMLLRPVYWLGNWQFACLNYYHPPKGIENRCIRAEKFPPVLQKLVDKMEDIVHKRFRPEDVPAKWKLNTCLVNYYGCKIEDGKKIDTARVGDHKDFEPGPVASLSIGERALIQFVASQKPGVSQGVAFQQWLDDGSLQIFGGERLKKNLFHRVQRVDKREGHTFPDLNTENFETRRINFTFRYVPEEHIIAYKELPTRLAADVLPYMSELAKHSEHFSKALDSANA